MLDPIEEKMLLENVPPENIFFLHGGAEIRNIKELYSAFESMGNDAFAHHVNSGRNDFGNWVKDVHQDHKLANRIFSSSSKEECMKAIGDRLYEIGKKTAGHSIALLPDHSLLKKEKVKVEKATAQQASFELLEKILTEPFKSGVEKSRRSLAEKKSAKQKEVLPEASLFLDPEKIIINDEPGIGDSSGRFSKEVLYDVLSVFSAASIKIFTNDMKKLFRSQYGGKNEAFITSPEKTLEGNEKKQEILSHLKKVYKE